MNSIVIGSGFGGIAAALRLKAAAIPPNPDPMTIEFILIIYSFFRKL